jgi:hypothetical protein
MKFPTTRGVIRLMIPMIVLVSGFLFNANTSFARPDYTRRTKQECAYCHPPGGWYLNDAGKYFRDHRTLNGYQPPADNKPKAPEAPSTKQDEKPKPKPAKQS